METVHKLADHICDLMNTDQKGRESLHIVINQCETSGLVCMQEIRQMALIGLPVIATHSAIFRIPVSEGKDKQLSYAGLCCVLGIIAQDLMVRSQKNWM